MLTKREEYIKGFFLNGKKDIVSDIEAGEIALKISKLGEKIGFVGVNISSNKEKNEKRKHKYDVWIAKEVKKDLAILEKTIDIRLIIDWAIETKADLFAYDFNSAFKEQESWHLKMMMVYHVEKMNIPSIDEKRIVFRFSDKKHFLYLLSENDLSYEGKMMGHCVSGTNYKSRVKNKSSLILSLRDMKNEPHLTLEIDVQKSYLIQQQGKANSEIKDKYLLLMKEFILFASNYKGLENSETLKFLNLHMI